MRALTRFQPDLKPARSATETFRSLLCLNVQIHSYVSQILVFASILVNTVICVLNER